MFKPIHFLHNVCSSDRMFNSLICVLFICITIISYTSYAQPNTKALELISNPHFDVLRIADSALIPSSRKIYIGDIGASFSSSWIKEFKGQTTSRYRNQILDEYSQALKNNIKQKLLLSGWQVFEQAEPGTLILKAKLTDLYIYGPQKQTREHILVKTIGQSTVSFIVEGIDQQAIMEMQDHRVAGSASNHFIEVDKGINYSRFNSLMQAWATHLVMYVDSVVEEPKST